jgi:1-aminocyclopropane-1-carboxylate deaminase
MVFELPILSPIEEIKHSELKNIRLFIKRDDMIHPFISGNKWRKLKYILADAHQQKKTHLVTFGGAFSNHILATACAGKKFGFQTTAFIRGEKVLPLNDTLYLCEQMGMTFIFTDRESYKDKKELYKKYFSLNDDTYFIDEGGASVEAVKGCSELINELDQENYGHIFVACGTASTMAGLIKGCEYEKLNTIIEGISVHKGVDALRVTINQYCPDNERWNLHEQFHEGGYAKVNEDYLKWLTDFSQQSGIVLDPIYTGKMMMGIFSLIKQSYFKSGAKVLAIHTGGLIGGLGITRFRNIN